MMILEKENEIKNNNLISKKREPNIDLLKTILVLGMIFSHVLDFLAKQNIVTRLLTSYFNLVSFSGFIFVFGYNSYNAYINNEKKDVNKKLLKNIYRLSLTFWISGIFSDFLLSKNHEIKNYIKILLFLRLPAYSEFLATFAILNLFLLLFKKKLKRIFENSKYIIVCFTLSFLFAILPSIKLRIPWINLILKTDIISFPLFPYMSLFFGGIFFSKKKPKFKIKVFFVFLCFGVIYIIINSRELATRFPVSIAFIIGSYIYIYLYYYISKYICKKIEDKKGLNFINFIGKNSLDFLLISNILLFIIRYIIKENLINNNLYLGISYIMIVSVCYLFCMIKKMKKIGDEKNELLNNY